MDPAPSSIGLSSAFCAYCYIGMHLPSPPTPLRADSQHVFYASCISPWHSQSMRGVSAYSHSIANCSTRIGGLGGLGEVASACWGNSFPSGILNHLHTALLAGASSSVSTKCPGPGLGGYPIGGLGLCFGMEVQPTPLLGPGLHPYHDVGGVSDVLVVRVLCRILAIPCRRGHLHTDAASAPWSHLHR